MKNIKLKTLGAVCIITGRLLIPVATQAATIEDLSNDLVDLEKNYHFDIKKRANRLEAGVYSNISKDNFALSGGFGKVTSQRETGAKKIYLGTNIFYNDSPTTQVYHTVVFSKAVTDSVSSTTTNGFSIGTQTQGGISIPLVSNGQFSISTEFNFSETNTNEQSTTKTYTVLSQDITVPSGKRYKTSVILEKKKVEGTVDLFGSLDFNIKNHKPYFMPEKYLNDVLFYNRDVKPPKFLDNAATILVTKAPYNDFEFKNVTLSDMWDDVENNFSSGDSGYYLERLKSKGLFRDSNGLMAKGEGKFSVDYATDLKVVTEEVDEYGNPIQTVGIEEETPIVK